MGMLFQRLLQLMRKSQVCTSSVLFDCQEGGHIYMASEMAYISKTISIFGVNNSEECRL